MIDPTRRITSAEIKDIKRELVYGWYRNGEYLYIGLSSVGIKRIITHNIIDRVEPFQDIDEIHIWDWSILNNTSYSSLSQLEVELIRWYKPKYNINKYGGGYLDIDGKTIGPREVHNIKNRKKYKFKLDPKIAHDIIHNW